MNVQTKLGSRDAKTNKPLTYAALLNSLAKNILKNKYLTYDRPASDCVRLKKLKLGRLV